MGVELYTIYLTLGMSVCLFVLSGVMLFGRGWEGYESQYLGGAGESLDELYLAIPPLHLMYLSVLVFILLGMVGALAAGSPVFGFFAGLPGLFFPTILVAVMRWQRLRKFENQLPDCLDNMKSSVQAGLALPQAFQVIVQESPDPTRQEFRIVCKEMALGVTQSDSLLHMLDRMPIADLRIAINAINITTEQGGDLPGMLKTTATVIRDRLELSGKLRSITSQGKLQGLIVSSIPFVLMWVIGLIDPEYMTPMLTTWPGWGLIGLIFALDLLGYLVIRAIVNIEI